MNTNYQKYPDRHRTDGSGKKPQDHIETWEYIKETRTKTERENPKRIIIHRNDKETSSSY